MAAKAEHRIFIKYEKGAYYGHRKKGRQNGGRDPSNRSITKRKYMSIIMDGMDQAKTHNPSLARSRKDTDGLVAQGQHLVGVLNHGSDEPVVCYINDDTLPNDSNLNMQILLDVIQTEQDRNGYLPEVCYIQLDNAPDNKNKWMLTLCAILVAVGLFRKIKMGFLPTGHTHEDIDQLFSRIAEYLRSHNVICLQDLIDCCKNSGTFEGLSPIVKHITESFNFKSWVDPIMPKFQNITEPMCYKFERDSTNDHVLLFARADNQTSKCSKPNCWFPDTGYEMCKVAEAKELWESDIQQIQPRDIDLPEIQKTVDKYIKLNLMSEDDQECWRKEMTRLKSALDGRCSECRSLRIQVKHFYDDFFNFNLYVYTSLFISICHFFLFVIYIICLHSDLYFA